MTPGTYVRTPEMRAAASVKRLAWFATPEGRAAFEVGRANGAVSRRGRTAGPRPPEVRAKISAALKGRKLSPERVAAIAAGHRGLVMSPEAKAKLVASKLGVKRPGIGVIVAAANLARNSVAVLQTPESRKKAALARIGRSLPPEVRAKISATRLALLAKRPIAPPRVIGVCVYCGDPATTLDHVIPRSRGGSNEPENLVPACKPCNCSKHDLTLEEWAGRKARLSS